VICYPRDMSDRQDPLTPAGAASLYRTGLSIRGIVKAHPSLTYGRARSLLIAAQVELRGRGGARKQRSRGRK
jgi:hypothetical protein